MKQTKTTDCSIVRDLLPLLSDDLVSEESLELVLEHLDTCNKCRTYMEWLKEEQKEAADMQLSKDNRLKRALKRRRYEMIGMLGGMVFLLVIIFIGLFQPFSGLLGKKDPYPVREHYEAAKDYGKQNYQGIAELSLFPAADALDGRADDFYYDCKGSELYQEYQIYLECSYDKEAYEAEKERLLAVTDDKTGRSVVYSEEEMKFPCVYAMLYDEGFEYALFAPGNKIIYIYLQGTDIRNLYFDRAYLPKDYGQAGYAFETEREAFRIYQTESEEFYNEE